LIRAKSQTAGTTITDAEAKTIQNAPVFGLPPKSERM
jgi:hypothetical protein